MTSTAYDDQFAPDPNVERQTFAIGGIITDAHLQAVREMGEEIERLKAEAADRMEMLTLTHMDGLLQSALSHREMIERLEAENAALKAENARLEAENTARRVEMIELARIIRVGAERELALITRIEAAKSGR